MDRVTSNPANNPTRPWSDDAAVEVEAIFLVRHISPGARALLGLLAAYPGDVRRGSELIEARPTLTEEIIGESAEWIGRISEAF